ncbi:MAG TPA: iron-sulfur cluster assembly scaffold protein [Candidatus Gracilibacteria bacterium]|nr:iron-sulfur cluster assembly scaffold protein [Candidatus Gracilibacteria bacterium]
MVYEEKNLSCGEFLHLEIRLDTEEKVIEAKFTHNIRLIGRASMNLCIENILNQELSSCLDWTPQSIEDWLDNHNLSEKYYKSAMLALLTWKNAARYYQGQEPLQLNEL